ncbi:MAG: lipopolysaccharide transport periplasmic protein LptA [Candidatus Competibacteraceae bacterium]|jgi:lipopolysaccharide export system protein LptA|nr:lipopolysaccharide transport periplasmic protein LptA [Candidatus Competibacteraceae bacterium]
MYRSSLNSWFLLVLLLLPMAATALPEDRKQPIRLEADSAQLNQQTGVSVYQGNVVISQGSMRLKADTATFYVNNGRFEKLEAIGKPVQLRYRPDKDKPEIQGVSQRVEYNVPDALVIMTTNAKITQGEATFAGNRIEYDLDKDLIKASGKDRIEFIIPPESIQESQR